LLDTGKILSVLPIFREILDNLKASPTTEALYASAALFALKFEGDSHLETFLNVFIKTHQKCRSHISGEAAAQVLFDKLSAPGHESKILDLELREFRRLPEHEKTIDKLVNPAY